MMKVLFKITITIILIPLGFISKLLYLIHSLINESIINVKGYIDDKYIKNWKTIWNIESEDTTWELLNGYLNEDGTTDKSIILSYFKDIDGYPSVQIELSHKEFEDLLAFTKNLNRKIIKK